MLLIFTTLILHEMGHIFFIILFKNEINKITFYPFGGVMEYSSKPDFIYKYFLISIGGILVNLILFFIFKMLNVVAFANINLFFVVINLVPIYPLDGSRILLSFLKIVFPYKLSKKMIYISSIIVSFVVFIFLYKIYNAWILLIFLALFLRLNINSIYLFDDEYNGFLLNKFLYPNNLLKTRQLRHFLIPIDKIYFGYNTVFDYDNFIVNEEVVLKEYFKKMKN
jgi:stage IV sporulation protein FB